MTLNGVIALILRFYFTEFDSFAGRLYHSMVEDRPVMSVKYCLPVLSTFGQNERTLQRDLSAMVELLVKIELASALNAC